MDLTSAIDCLLNSITGMNACRFYLNDISTLHTTMTITMSVYVFSCFPFGFKGRMWDLIVSVPDHCLSFYFGNTASKVFENSRLGLTESVHEE